MRRHTWPLVGDLPAFRADRLGFFTRLSHQQGDVARFRIGPYRGWSLSHPELVGEVLVAQAGRFHKGPVLHRARLVLGEGLLTSEGDRHREDRRALQPAFHPDRIAGYGATMVAGTEAEVRGWRAGVPLDLHARMVAVTLTTAARTLLGADIRRDVATIRMAIDDLLAAYRLGFVPFGWRLQRLPVGPARRLQRGRRALASLIDRLIAERRRDGIDRGDLLSSLIRAGDLPDHRIREQAVTLLLAGHETTANALTFAVHLLATDPLVDAAIGEELARVAGDRPPSADDVERLPRCRALVAEALRLYPPSWAISRQVVEPPAFDGLDVRAGDVVVVSPWVVHRDERWWPQATRVDLRRHDGNAADARPRWAYFPFGAGARRCLGEGFAWAEATLALATIRRRWRLAPACDGRPQLDPLITLRPRGGLTMVPERAASAGRWAAS